MQAVVLWAKMQQKMLYCQLQHKTFQRKACHFLVLDINQKKVIKLPPKKGF